MYQKELEELESTDSDSEETKQKRPFYQIDCIQVPFVGFF